MALRAASLIAASRSLSTPTVIQWVAVSATAFPSNEMVAKKRHAALRTRLLVGHRLDWPEGVQCVFSVANNTVPIIDQYLFIELDPLPQKGQIVRIEPASYYPDRGAESDGDHLGTADPRNPGDFDLDVVPCSASLRNEYDEWQPSALGPQISHFVGGLAFRLCIGTTWFRGNFFADRRG